MAVWGYARPLAPATAAELSEGVSASFALEAPRFTKADWPSERLTVGDLNGDARIDLATVNNPRGVLQIFLQGDSAGRKNGAAENGSVASPISDAGAPSPGVFSKEEEVLSDSVAALSVGDFNGDGRDDLVLAPRDRNVLVRFQTQEGVLAPAVPLETKGLDLRSDDLDGDGIADLTVFSTPKVDIFFGAKSDSILTVKPVSLFNGASPGSRLYVGDFDGDGNADLLYRDANRRSRVMVRFQTAPRRWGLESAFEIVDSSEDLVAIPGPAGGPGPARRARLAAIDSKTREVRVFQLESTPEAAETLPLDGPYFLALGDETRSDKESVLAADVNGDGQLDILAASPESAEIALFVQSESQGMDLRATPSLSGIVSLAAVATKRGSLVFSRSDREETIGVSVWDPNRGLTVPKFLDTGRKPLAMAVADLDGSGKADLLYLFKEQAESVPAGQAAALRLAVFADPSDPSSFEKGPILWPLPPGLKMEEPDSMLAADLNGDKRCDLMIVSKYAPLALLMQDGKKGFVSLATDEGIKKGIFNNVRAGQIRIDDLEGDGTMEMLIARQNFVRAYRLDERGDLAMVEQFNGRGSTSRIESVVLADLNGSGGREIVLFDTGGNVPVLTIYERAESGVYRLVRHQDIEGVRGDSLAAGDFGGSAADDLLISGGERMHLFYSGQSHRAMKPVWKRAPEDKEGQYARLFGVRLLDAQKEPCGQILALEGTEHLLEFLLDKRESTGAAPGADFGAGTRFFEFKVFDDDASVSGAREMRRQPEPREIVATDVDGDGLRDLVALAHDNILYYRQTEPDEKEKAH